MQIPGRIIFRDKTGFSEIIVADDGNKRSLYLDGDTLQSCMYRNQPHILAMEYSHAMMCALLFNGNPSKTLLVGLGGASLIKFLLHVYPAIDIDVAEINPAIISVARDFFCFEKNAGQVVVFPEAGEALVKKRLQEGYAYDLVLIDAFDDSGPARALLSREFLDDCRSLLDDDGIFAMNLWNRPQDGFYDIYGVIAECFRGRTLKLLLAESYDNAIAFGFKAPVRARELLKLKGKARGLGNRTGINFSRYLRALYWQNFS